MSHVTKPEIPHVALSILGVEGHICATFEELYHHDFGNVTHFPVSCHHSFPRIVPSSTNPSIVNKRNVRDCRVEYSTERMSWLFVNFSCLLKIFK